MPFYIKDSVTIGPFRVNLSKSGLGFSSGVKGFRFGTGPKGHYIHAGMNGIYYRKTLGGLGRKPKSAKSQSNTDYTSQFAKIAPNEKLPTYMTEDGVLMRRILSAEAEVLVSETHSEALNSLNQARDRPSLTFILGGLAAIVVVLSLFSQDPVFVVVSLVLFGIAFSVGRMIDIPRRNVVFAYDLAPDMEDRYKALVDSIDVIGRSSKLWFVKASGDITSLHAWKKHAGASGLVDTKETSISYILPPGVASNITPPMIVVDGKNCYFFPDCVLVEENKRFGAVRYESLRTAIRDQRMIMDVAPSDASVVGQTWKYVNKNGGPDRRFNDNRQLPICLFDEIAMVSDGGFKGLLQISKHGSSKGFGAATEEIGRITVELKNAEPLLITQKS